ncbi:hypothetical protein ACJX0J_022549, partial [Zea mays]
CLKYMYGNLVFLFRYPVIKKRRVSSQCAQEMFLRVESVGVKKHIKRWTSNVMENLFFLAHLLFYINFSLLVQKYH